jgi:hypothetical protein
MATFTGTAANETITPTTVSGTVTRNPAGSLPSAANDTILGGAATMPSMQVMAIIQLMVEMGPTVLPAGQDPTPSQEAWVTMRSMLGGAMTSS